MSNINKGGPAFPTPRYERGDIYSLGMDLRDYFAAHALQGICASGPSAMLTNAKLAREAYELADAMLAERLK